MNERCLYLKWNKSSFSCVNKINSIPRSQQLTSSSLEVKVNTLCLFCIVSLLCHFYPTFHIEFIYSFVFKISTVSLKCIIHFLIYIQEDCVWSIECNINKVITFSIAFVFNFYFEWLVFVEINIINNCNKM